ncbi:hypothetical protein POV27_01580 [Aureisphaera galaxeae]|uniref:hypothetical protein n=1 Tax=Aureisphaera galaxeae TaxID=1538023 RepID=UPI002350A6A8|nr:hypothetical protein [Aureisphaera galaxeae]MDC8002730.1 hypothetical protein [Aureisphaera galaxeae]
MELNNNNLKELIEVHCSKKGYTEYDYEEFITYTFLIHNKSDNGIRAIKGEVVFNNIFDEKIQSMSFVYDQPIKAGGKVTWNATTEYNPYRSEDRALRDKDLKDIKLIWNPEKVILQNGSTLG